MKKFSAGKEIFKALLATSVLEQKDPGYVLLKKLVSDEWGDAGGEFFVAYGQYGKQNEFGAGLLFSSTLVQILTDAPSFRPTK